MQNKSEKLGAGALFMSSSTGRIMLNFRAPYKTHKLTWSLWGGMIEEGESPKQCLEREMKEEMGFIPDISKFYPFDVYQSKDKNFKYYSFICVVENEFIPTLNKESAGYCWVDLGTWPKPLHNGARISLCNPKALEKLELILNQH